MPRTESDEPDGRGRAAKLLARSDPVGGDPLDEPLDDPLWDLDDEAFDPSIRRARDGEMVFITRLQILMFVIGLAGIVFVGMFLLYA